MSDEEALYVSASGVCSGTPSMIERTLEVFVEGTGAVAKAIEGLDEALDYAFAAAPLVLVRSACDARSRLIVSEVLAREVALEDERHGAASMMLRRAQELGARLAAHVDPEASPLVAPGPVPPEAEPLLAVLGVEADALALMAERQRRVNDVLGRGTPGPTREALRAGLTHVHERLWSERVAEHLGWRVVDDGLGLDLGTRVALRPGARMGQRATPPAPSKDHGP